MSDTNSPVMPGQRLDWDELEANLLIFDDLCLDCDGISDLISLYLDREGLSHRYLQGSVLDTLGGDLVSPHCWIEIDGRVIDFRLRKWLEHDDRVPHGLFVPTDQFRYCGVPVHRPRQDWVALGLAHPMNRL